jgi:poly(3-hydroxybutyrate) depolymerase
MSLSQLAAPRPHDRLGRRAACVLAAATICAVTLLAHRAQAQVKLAPAQDGHLGAWLVAGPIAEVSMRKLDLGELTVRAGARITQANWAPRWQLRSHADGALDLRRLLGPTGGAYALLAGQLSLRSQLRGWLLLSADGGVTVTVDGRTLFSRDLARLRDRCWDAVPITLPEGEHTLVLKLHQHGRHWAVAVRILDGKDLLAPDGFSLVLPGTTAQDTRRLAHALLTVSVEAGLSRAGYRPRCVIEYRRGVPRAVDLRASVEIRRDNRAEALYRARLGSMVVAQHGVGPLRALLPPLKANVLDKRRSAQPVRFTVQVGAERHTRELAMSPAAPPLFARAWALLEAVGHSRHPRLTDPAATAATLRWHLEQVRSAATPRRGGTAALSRALAELESLVTALEQGGDPLRRPGVIDVALRSVLDGRPQHMRIHVPDSYEPGGPRRYPLVVLLHGYDGSPETVMRAFLDRDGRSAHPAVDGFVLAPYAHGNSFYRGPGEQAVMAALDWMTHNYPIDPQRVSITGVSMGGTGAAQLALRYAYRFAAAAPLCGYHSFFVRRDLANVALRPWERDRMHHWSPASIAPNGRHLPMYVAHGTRDLPLDNSRVLVAAYRRLGYSMFDEWPETGHAVWKQTYAGARMWSWLSRHRRDPDPERVTLRTDALRYGALDWVRITALQSPGKMAQVDARFSGEHQVSATTEGVAEFELLRSEPRLRVNAPVTVQVDGQTLSFAGSEPLLLHRDGVAWHKGELRLRGQRKRAGAEGPIRDVWLGPVLFVFGSLDPATTRANREVAESLAELSHGIDIRYAVVSDRQVTREMERDHSLVLVGNAQTNRILSRLDARLPIRVAAGRVLLGAQSFAAEEVGTVFIHPNPDQPDRYVVAVEAPTVRGLWRALSLPQLLPDFLVFDAGLAPAAAEQVLGAASVLAGGFFANDWSLPKDTRDPEG